MKYAHNVRNARIVAGAILNGSDPSQILQRGSELLFPSTPWEMRAGDANKWY
jgi:hypothetical protein